MTTWKACGSPQLWKTRPTSEYQLHENTTAHPPPRLPAPQVSLELDFEVAELMGWREEERGRGGCLCLLTSFESDNAFQTGKFSGIQPELPEPGHHLLQSLYFRDDLVQLLGVCVVTIQA